jgi:Cu/Ag efflux protein CusF
MTPTHLLLAAALACVAVPALAQHQHHGSATAAASATTDGEVRRVDAMKGTILLKHGDMKGLGMGPMTMGFKLKDPKMALSLKEGDKVRFTAMAEGNDLVVTEIKKLQ